MSIESILKFPREYDAERERIDDVKIKDDI